MSNLAKSSIPQQPKKHTPMILFILKIIYLPAGIFINEKYDKFIVPYFIIFHILVAIGSIRVIASYFDKDSSNLEVIYTQYGASTIYISLWVGQLNKQYYKALYQEIKQFGTQFEEFVQIFDKMIKSKISAIIGVYCTQLLSLPVPIYALIFANADYQDFIALLYPTLYPWKRDTLVKYIITMVIQFVSLSFGFCLLTFFLGTFCCATLYLYIRFLLLRHKIVTIEDRMLSKINCKKSYFEVPKVYTFTPSDRLKYEQFYRKLDGLIYDEFNDVIKEHQKLLKFAKSTMQNFTLPIHIILGYFYVTAITLCSIVLKESAEYNLHKIKVSALCSLAIISFSICCICGEVILQLNENLKNTIFGTEWYKYSYRIKKHVVIFMMQNQRACDIRAFRMFVLNHYYWGRAIKLCYSFIQLLSSRVK